MLFNDFYLIELFNDPSDQQTDFNIKEHFKAI